ncbi:MAG: tRNA 2-thiouridine(34) synthase MnmA [Candidatus Taylorbacteria bacterium]|nr:tRNA 2-thiouridine(34) synthase MnmA [Candidatus Taylorbacteria bacterium]
MNIPRGNNQKVYVGMSGGVDSSVSAALLKEAGYDVTGVFIKVWQPDWVTCTWKEDRLDALRVAAQLDIPFITLDLEADYKKHVVDYMVSEYTAGRTPNPDVMCNKYVKFGAFFDWAIKQGADYVATGHYAQTVTRADGTYLAKGNDPTKDQSYFLWTLHSTHLKKTLFPVGDIEKTEVRKLAQKFKLPNATKKDSQGLCFIGKVELKEFLSHFVTSTKGNVISETGKVLGSHDGAVFYTIGQRHGFTVDQSSPNELPYFVINKNIDQNTITVSHDDPRSLVHSPTLWKVIRLHNTLWSNNPPQEGKVYQVRARYRQELVECVFKKIVGQENEWLAEVSQPLGATPGQSLVVYDQNICIGGGSII